ncbi:MAG: hypothetical protein GY795_43735 [Desulfobacterales bacterium]|nr:hypothetical protein [Desulfobacterales bacterium]
MKKRYILTIGWFIMALCFIFFTVSEASAFIPGYIAGVVFDENTKEPIGTAIIKTSAGRSAISNINGTYRITNEEGTFTLTAEAEGYLTYSDTIEVRPLETIVRDIPMTPVSKRILTVTKTGSGTVTDNNSGIDCGTDCSEEYIIDTVVTLTANPDTGWNFKSWTGDCTGTQECAVAMDSNKNVSAVFQKAVISDHYENDNTYTRANIIDTPQHHNFHNAGDEDWVMFYGIPDKIYTIKAANPEANCDIVIALYDSDGTRMLGLKDNGRYGEDETIEWNCRQEDIYYVKIRNYDPEVFGSNTGYDLYFHNSQGHDAYEEDDNYEQARAIVINDNPRRHNFHAHGDEDWVKFYGISENWYTIEVTNLGADCDAVIELYDSDSTKITDSEEQGIEDHKKILDFILSADGIYYVKIKNSDPEIFNEETEYDLRIYYPEFRPSSYLSGRISDKDTGEPVEAAKIKTGADMSAISLINGTFNMRHDAGTYILTAEADGYETYSAEIEIRETGTPDINISMKPITVTPSDQTGDIDNSGATDLQDCILALKILTGINADDASPVYKEADANNDKKIGMAEAVYILQNISGLRNNSG